MNSSTQKLFGAPALSAVHSPLQEVEPRALAISNPAVPTSVRLCRGKGQFLQSKLVNAGALQEQGSPQGRTLAPLFLRVLSGTPDTAIRAYFGLHKAAATYMGAPPTPPKGESPRASRSVLCYFHGTFQLAYVCVRQTNRTGNCL